MGIFKFLQPRFRTGTRIKRNGIELNESYIVSAEKTASIIDDTIRDGEYGSIPGKLQKYSSPVKEKLVFEAPPIWFWIIMILAASVLTVFFGYILSLSVGTMIYSSSYRQFGGYGLIMAVLVFVINISVIAVAVNEIRFSRRYGCYQNVLRYRHIEIVGDLAEMAGTDKKIVEKDLRKAVKRKLIPQGHFGRRKMIFMVSDRVFAEYSNNKASYDRYFKKLIEDRERMMGRTPETEELLEKGREYIEKIHDSNDIIKDKEISKKLDRMERVVSAIFHEVDVNPSQANKLGLLMGYYLPTTEKLLEAYMEMDEKQVRGKYTEKTLNEISNAIDSINDAFEGLLDRFYREQERDIVSEIYAMDAIMKQEGLRDE